MMLVCCRLGTAVCTPKICPGILLPQNAWGHSIQIGWMESSPIGVAITLSEKDMKLENSIKTFKSDARGIEPGRFLSWPQYQQVDMKSSTRTPRKGAPSIQDVSLRGLPED